MKKLYVCLNTIEAQMLKDVVSNADIVCMIKNEQLGRLAPEIPFTECYPEIWILNEADYAKAREIIDRWLESKNEDFEAWVCPDCGVEIEGQFAACWNCAYELGTST